MVCLIILVRPRWGRGEVSLQVYAKWVLMLFYLGKMTVTENLCVISLLKIAHISPLMSKLKMISFYLLAQSQQLLNYLLSCLLLNKFLTCCNFPSIVVMILKLSTSTGNKSQPRGYVLIESKNKFWGTFSFKMGVRKRVKSRSSPYKNADIISFYYPQT